MQIITAIQQHLQRTGRYHTLTVGESLENVQSTPNGAATGPRAGRKLSRCASFRRAAEKKEYHRRIRVANRTLNASAIGEALSET